MVKILLFANTDWYLYNFCRSLALALREAGNEVLFVSPPGPYGNNLSELGFRWLVAPMKRRSLNPFRELAVLWWLQRLLMQEKVDLVHSFTIKSAVYGSLASHLTGVPGIVNTVAGMGYVFTSQDLKARLLKPVIKNLMRLSLNGRNARLILQNPDDVALFKHSRIVDQTRIRMVSGSGVDCCRFTPSLKDSSPGTENRHFRVVLPARLLWDKGVTEYVQAARILHEEGRAIEFLVAGKPDPGNPASVPESALKRWVDEGVINWLGHVEDMPELFRSVDVAVLPSYREGLPTGLIEAAACGLALVATNVPGCREAVTNGVDGLLVPVKNATALAEAVACLQDDSELRITLGNAARRKAITEFDKDIVIEKTINIYREMIPGISAQQPIHIEHSKFERVDV